MFVFYKFKWQKILKFYKIYTLEKYLKYYHIFSVSGAIYNKNYFLKLWLNHSNKVDENLQIKNAISMLKKNKNLKFAHLNQENLSTSFITSASNDKVFKLNSVINESWFLNEFNFLENFPKDYSNSYFESIIKNNELKQNWKIWCKMFKMQYEKMGCKFN